MAIQLDKPTQKLLTDSIKRFFSEELEEEIGDLKAGRVLEFVLKEIGPSLYNQAIADAQAYLHEKASELGEVRFEPEFGYWRKR
jgi:uncharacterized protein (DUF2164 family)